MRYRIYTEDKDRSNIVHLTALEFTGATFTDATGLWEGHEERSVVIELITPGERDEEVRRLADAIKRANKQESVLVTREDTITILN